ncbi:MAG: hypothetical protein K6U75_01625 [Firmicutes bacterium]|nr:hypothetical protein [Bacillota bacterium]
MTSKRKPDAGDASHAQEPEITVWVRRDMRDWRKALFRAKGISGIRSNERVWSKPAVSDGQKPVAFPTKRRPFHQRCARTRKPLAVDIIPFVGIQWVWVVSQA